MLRIGSDQPAPPDQGGQPPTPPPDQMEAASQPDVQPEAGGDHAQQLVQALTHLRLAMELLIGCLGGGGDQSAEGPAPEPAEGADQQEAP